MRIIEKLPSWVIRLKWPIIITGSTLLLSILGYLFIIFGGRFVFDEKQLILPATTTIVTEDQEKVGLLYEENRMPVTIEQIPEHVEQAFLAIEDRRFYDHAGVSFPSVARALYRDVISMQKAEGGSTITQQLAKNLFLTNEKTWMRKTKEVMAAIYLERNFSKKRILELYLNEIYFAHGIFGVGAASDFYFGKNVEALTVQEGALLAALSKAPNTYSPFHNPEKAKERRDLVLEQMNRYGMLETDEMLEYQGKTLGVQQREEVNQPWIDDYLAMVIKEAEEKYQLTLPELKRGGYKIVVNMNKKAQQIAYEQFQQDTHFYGSSNEVEGAFVLMNQESGKLEAVLGGRKYQLGDLHRAVIPRQPGSVMKPLAVYGPAMMLEDYQPYTFLADEQHSYDGYTAANADGQYDGTVTMYDAIRESKNAPAVWLLDQIGIGYSKSYLEKMDISLPDKGLSIALGGLENGLTPIQLVQSYRPFIHNGQWIKAHTIDRIENREGEQLDGGDLDEQEVFSPEVAWNMVRMLESVVTDGTGSEGEYAKALAGKTGSTQHPLAEGQVKDAWFVGVNPDYVTALWMGFDKSDASRYLTKGSAAPTILTKNILSELDKQQALTANFQVPKNITDLAEPIRHLPKIIDLEARYRFGGLSLVKGELTWTAARDERIIYEIYEDGEKIDEVEGKGSFTIDQVSIFSNHTYHVVPYDPLTDQRGEPSNQEEI
ncbi:transglycosylase domain-containing protein [Aquibacillus albus]|uniref:Penicillin-binding protein 2A n=1 Tax=Aquibacillus albus TaxID=1168171 RepID=A0ABS2N030_9BACI|nr:transglycosylase domain-containing protein [Aquibacillus albus]MBM7571467.1 penicillin-binding protein 2A [Aquibacillus albus]